MSLSNQMAGLIKTCREAQDLFEGGDLGCDEGWPVAVLTHVRVVSAAIQNLKQVAAEAWHEAALDEREEKVCGTANFQDRP